MTFATAANHQKFMQSNSHYSAKLRTGLIALLIGIAGAVTAQANPVLGGQIFANGGDVTATFLSSDAGYDNLLYYASTANGVIFEGHVTHPGTSDDLGSFAAGTLLTFVLNNQQGNLWYTGPASMNSDGIAHAIVDGSYAPGVTYVGFEDLNGGGDRDYNDLEFTVSNTHVPDAASTMPLLGMGLVGLIGFARRFRK